MRFFHISKPDGQNSHQAQSEYFYAACNCRGIEYVRLLEKEMDPVSVLSLTPKNTDIVYRSASGHWAKSVEKELLRGDAKSIFYGNASVLLGKGNSHETMERVHLPVIPSVPFLPSRKRDADTVAEHLGGYPVVIKIAGGMEGVGVMRVDSTESFNSVAEYIRRDAMTEARVMKYIPHSEYARLVVVGDRVVASTKDRAPVGDFRANARGYRGQPGIGFVSTEEMNTLAVAATQSLNIKVGGADILFGDDGRMYIAEVNSPFNFAETQQRSGVDIAAAIVDCLTAA